MSVDVQLAVAALLWGLMLLIAAVIVVLIAIEVTVGVMEYRRSRRVEAELQAMLASAHAVERIQGWTR